MNYFLHNSDITIDLTSNKLEVMDTKTEAFKVTLVETGLHTKTAGRIKKVQKYIGNEDFMLTYGDGIADINLHQLINFHKQNNKVATVTAVRLDARFGGMDLNDENMVTSFREKSKDDSKWINGGFFVLKPEVFKYLEEDTENIMWEEQPLEKITNDLQLAAYKHDGFWKCMDALRDKIELEELLKNNQAKWKVW
jgi:glucose-1-phosphate cytidylyltransferase